VSFATITLCVASQVFTVVVVVVVVYFITDSVQKLLDTPSNVHNTSCNQLLVCLNMEEKGEEERPPLHHFLD